MMDMYEKHIDEFCPEKWDSANEFAEGVDYEWEPEVLEAKAEAWAMENDCLGDDNKEMDTFDIVDMFWEHIEKACPEKWDSANEWASEVDFEWTPEKMADEAKMWAEENDCLGDEDWEKYESEWSEWYDEDYSESDWSSDEEEMDTFEMMDMYEKHIDEFCPEKWDSANEFAEGVDYEWEPEVLAAKAEAWAMENDCLGDDNEDYYESDWSSDEEEMDTFEMMDMYWEHVNEFCPEKWILLTCGLKVLTMNGILKSLRLMLLCGLMRTTASVQ
jgi:hypothetical protein